MPDSWWEHWSDQSPERLSTRMHNALIPIHPIERQDENSLTNRAVADVVAWERAGIHRSSR